ncbi:MAG: outer membrane protein assembly factor [Gemmatimonadetes bacterium]|nr:outer membrane protein assembly factor [Gemmatimonadota bacterium]
MTSLGRTAVAGLAIATIVPLVGAPACAAQTGLQVGGVPALNYDADEGFGYGVVAALYQYGDGAVRPYRWSLHPTVFLTTEGRRDFTLFFDAPEFRGRWRLDAFVGSRQQIATPYYGLGNASEFDEAAVTDENPRYFRFGRTLRSALVNVQRPLGDTPLRLLLGAGAIRGTFEPIPEGEGDSDGEGATLVSEEIAAGTLAGIEGWATFARAGLVWDTRDRETGPRSGTWSDLLIQRVDETLGGVVSYTRWTLTDRRYFSLGPIVFANRLLLQGTGEGVPLFDLHRIQTSFRDQEGLGGSRSVRGVLRNRYAGRGLFIWNAEVRWEAAGFDLVGRAFDVVLSAFADAGRVWDEEPRVDELLADLHRGWGGGVRLVMGRDFVIAVDAGTGAETGLQLYIGLGYLY